MVRLGSPNMITLSAEQFETIIWHIKKRGDVLAFYIYGSYGTKYQTIFSDVDFAILPMPGAEFDFRAETEILVDLNEICKSDDIGLLNLRKVPPTLQMNVLDLGRLLYSADKILLADFIETVIKLYCDFEPDLKAFYEDYDIGLKEEYL